jgi:methyl-accepting chemotaxis protein
MNLSIRTKFTLGMIFLFLIILVLSVFSGFYLNKLSKKTSAILKENYLSVIYAREMSDGLTNINQEIISCFLLNKFPDSLFIKKELDLVHSSLESEKKNITEPGEAKLVSDIESGTNEYCDSVSKSIKTSLNSGKILNLQKKSGVLFQQLVLLSQINGKAIEVKTDDAKVSSKNALTQMTILGTFCFLIAFSFAFSFASYFNERFFALYNGIKEIVASNYDQRLYFHGKDEFYEISLVFNKMAEKLNLNKEKMSLTLHEDSMKANRLNDIQELKNALSRIKSIEEQTAELISRLEKQR